MAFDQWNNAWVKADKALQSLPKKSDGSVDWGTVCVAHLDTGYTEHEVFGVWRGRGPHKTNDTILTKLGKDYFRPNRKTAKDPLKKGFLLHPGHGTRSGSALSGHNPAKGFTGIAPGLPLIPYRVTDSSLIDRDAARAIGKAIDEVRRKKKTPIVNIALGHLFPHRVVGQAIDDAYRYGIIVICAGGQKVDRVAYPGKHRRTITVAGVTKRGKRFSIYNKYDSYSRIDSWAPANPIYRANYPDDDRYGKGDGSTYSTMHVTGAAAIWLRARGPEIQSLYGNSWMRVEAFRKLISLSQGKLPFRNPDSNHAGRLDIEKLIALDLPPVDTLQEETDRAADDVA